jgi:hypothetical protein
MVPGLETRLMEGLEEDLVSIAEMVCLIIYLMSKIVVDHFRVLASEGGIQRPI